MLLCIVRNLYCFTDVFCSYSTNATPYVFWHSFIPHIRDMLLQTNVAIVRRYHKNINGKVRKREE